MDVLGSGSGDVYVVGIDNTGMDYNP